jgi:hypothetical protein
MKRGLEGGMFSYLFGIKSHLGWKFQARPSFYQSGFGRKRSRLGQVYMSHRHSIYEIRAGSDEINAKDS